MARCFSNKSSYKIKDNDDSNRLQLELACSPQVESDTFKTTEGLL